MANIRWIGSGLTIAAVGFGLFYFLSQTFAPAFDHQTHGFAAYYTGAWMLWNGRINGLYDPAQFNAAMQATGISGIYDIYDANSPLLPVATLPLAWWPPMLSRSIWLCFNLGLLLIVIWQCVRLLRPIAWEGRGIAIAGLLLYAPLNENFRLGQVYLPFLLAALLMLTGGTTGGAVAMAVQLIFKLYYGFFALAGGLIQWRRAVMAVGIFGGLAIVLLPWLGLNLWLDYIKLAGSFNSRPYIGVTAYQTLNGLFAHLLQYSDGWNTQPIANLPWLARLLTYGTSIVLVGLSVWAIWRAGRRAGAGWHLSLNDFQLAVGLAMCLGPIVAPAAEEYHFTLLLVPLVIGLRCVLSSPDPSGVHPTVYPSHRIGGMTKEGEHGGSPLHIRRVWYLVVWLVAVALLGPVWFYKTWNSAGWSALLCYPRLYGALVLWALLWRLLMTSQEVRRAKA